MGMTMAEKILANAAELESTKAGEIVTVNLDYCMSNDGTTHFTVDMYNEKLKNPHIANAKNVVFIIDHNSPADSCKTAASHKKMRDFAKENGITFYESKGVCHQLMMENHVTSGQVIVAADSHTCTYGALGAFGTGVGNTDFLYAMVSGKTWMMVPKTLRFVLSGKLSTNVSTRDLMLTIIGDIGANGANYKAMEFCGDGLLNLSVEERMVISNLAVEAGAKTALMPVDEKVCDYLKAHGRSPKAIFASDDDADFEKTYYYDLATITPVVAKPHLIDNVVPLNEASGTKIDEAFLGSCNSGRIGELRMAANLLKNQKVHKDVRFIISPASNEIMQQAIEEGLAEIFVGAGAMLVNPNCSVCWGACQGVMGDGEVLISTGTRNFKGRAGHKNSKVYLASAYSVTMAAIKGEI